jgi:hypothetical protein
MRNPVVANSERRESEVRMGEAEKWKLVVDAADCDFPFFSSFLFPESRILNPES